MNFSELPANLWHDRYTSERLEALGIRFLPVESLTEYYSQFEEIISSDMSAESLSPLDKDYCPEISRIMVINGELAGWCLSRELSKDAARISPVYVVKKFRSRRAGAIMEGHVMNILKQKYSGIRLFYDKKKDAHLIRFYSFYFGKAFTETARIFRLVINLK